MNKIILELDPTEVGWLTAIIQTTEKSYYRNKILEKLYKLMNLKHQKIRG